MKNATKRTGAILYALTLSVGAWAAPADKVPQEVIVRNTVGVNVLNAPLLLEPNAVLLSCYTEASGSCEGASAVGSGGYIWGIEFYVRKADTYAPCVITAFIGDYLITQFKFQTTLGNDGTIIATSDNFNRLLLPRVIPVAYSDVVKMHLASAAACNASVSFLTSMLSLQ